MIYLTYDEISQYYGKAAGGPSKSGRFNATGKSSHKDQAYKYEFGYLNGLCCYAIIQKTEGSMIRLEEAYGLRKLSGKGEWKLNKVLDPDKNLVEIQKILDTPSEDLGYFYSPSADDRFKGDLICVHQKGRHQLVIYHPKCRVDLAQIEKDPI